MKKFTKLMLASAALSATLGANAAVVTANSNTVIDVEGSGGGVLQFDKFNSALGTLQSVRIDLYSKLYDGELKLENTGSAGDFTIGVAGDLTLTVGADTLLTHASKTESFSLGNYDGVTDYDGVSGRNVALATWVQSNFGLYTTGLNSFIGNGKYSGAVLGASFQKLTGDNGNADYYALVTMDGYAKVTYEYTAAPVPEPETYAMLLAGLGLMGVVARRRKSA